MSESAAGSKPVVKGGASVASAATPFNPSKITPEMIDEIGDEAEIDTTVIKNQVKEWVNLDKELTEIRKKVKELNDRKKELTQHITAFMSMSRVDSFNIGEAGQISCETKDYFSSITKAHIHKCLLHFIPDEKRVTEIVTYIYDSREKVERSKLSKIIASKKYRRK
jgi:hypothetical protein